MIPEIGEPNRCLKDPVSYSSGSEHTVMSAEETRTPAERTAPVPSSWVMCPWIHPRSSSSPEPPVTLGSPLPYITLSGVYYFFFEGFLHIHKLLLPLVSFSSYCIVLLLLGIQLPLILFLLLQRVNSLRGLDLHLIHLHSLQWRSSRWRIC